MNIEMILSGFFFWFIIITNFASDRFGYETFSDPDSEAKLQWIVRNPKKFKIGVVIILIEHSSIIVLAILLFAALSPYNIVLAVIWTISRSVEGLIQIYYKKGYWGLVNLARRCVPAYPGISPRFTSG